MPRLNKRLLKLLLTGLAAGDAVGLSTEFMSTAEAALLYEQRRGDGFPWRSIGGGAFRWAPGEVSDDTDLAVCIVRAFDHEGQFDPQAAAAEFVGWLNGGPRDVGGTTRRVLTRLRRGVPWFQAGREEFDANPTNEANGSLSRNGVVRGMAGGLDEAFRGSLLQGIITHFGPLPVICCAMQTWMIHELAERRWPFKSDRWKLKFHKAFSDWLDGTTDPFVRLWTKQVGLHLHEAWEKWANADFSPYSFNPFDIDFIGRAGHCLLTLQIAVWALCWSIMDDEFPAPAGLPAEIFKRREGWTLGWIPLLANDCDSYGACAGPLIALAHGALPASFTEELSILNILDELEDAEVRT